MGISVGLVGLGMFGGAFADMFMNHPLVDRIALCDREPERMERFPRKELWEQKGKFDRGDMYPSFDEILKSDLDALVIITQPWLHAEQCIRAMEVGKHVYSAVPIVSLPDGNEILDWCDRVIDTCKKTGMRYMLGETTFYHPQAMFCRRKAEEDLFGDFVYAEGEYFHDIDWPRCNLRHIARARTSSASGKEWLEVSKKYKGRNIEGGPMHYPTHSTSGPVCVMKAHATKAIGYGYRSTVDGNGITDEIGIFEMSNGAIVRICEFRECAGSIGKESETFRIVGTRGTFTENRWICNHRAKAPQNDEEIEALHALYEDNELEVDQMRDPLPPEVCAAFAEACEAQRDAKGDFTPQGHGGSHPYLVHEFVDAVAHNRQPAINAWEAARYMAMGVMAHQSALKDGERLDVPDWGDAPE